MKKKTYQEQLESIRIGVKVVSHSEKIHGLITDITNICLYTPESATVEVRLFEQEGIGTYEYYPLIKLPQYFDIDPRQ